MNRHIQFVLASISAGASAAATLVALGALVLLLIRLDGPSIDDNAPLRAAGVLIMVLPPGVFVLVGLGTWILGYLAPASAGTTAKIAAAGVLLASLYMPVVGLFSDEPLTASAVGELALVFAFMLLPLATGVLVWWKLVARVLMQRWSAGG